MTVLSFRSPIHSGHPPRPDGRRASTPDTSMPVLEMRAPRYTSYPTTDRFVEAFTGADYVRNLSAMPTAVARSHSLHVHLPLGESLCERCGCATPVTQNHRHVARYLDRVFAEIRMLASQLSPHQSFNQIHWVGGATAFMNQEQIRGLFEHIQEQFVIDPAGRHSIEIDPRLAGAETIAFLGSIGFSGISIVVQGFDPTFLRADRSLPDWQQTADVIQAARASGFHSVNVDLIYGRPNQSQARFAQDLDSIVMMRPDRIALDDYTHSPERLPTHCYGENTDRPCVADKTAMVDKACTALKIAGYENIGMDHFVLSNSDPSIAGRRGFSHRGLPGYAAQSNGDHIAIGVGAISRVGACYSQNHRSIRDYCAAIDQGQIPVVRGIELSRDDLVRRAVITALMCHREVSMSAIEIAFLIDFRTYFAREIALLSAFEQCDMVGLDDDVIEVRQCGQRNLLPTIASVFDRYFQSSKRRATVSRVM